MSDINRLVKLVAEQSIEKSSEVLEKSLNTNARIDLKEVTLVDISDATAKAYEANQEVVGTLIDLVGDAPFKFLFYVNMSEVFMLTDLFLAQEVGTTKEFDDMSKSCIQELGNIISSAITNVFAANFQITMRPNPPTVLHDFSGSLFEAFVMEVAYEADQLLLIESAFQITEKEMGCKMYLLPVAGSEHLLAL